MREFAEMKGGKCLSKKYLNCRTPLEWQCTKRHKWKARFGNIISGKWCPECGRIIAGKKRRLSIEEMRELAESRGGKCLSKNYRTARERLLWKCSQGHKWEATPDNIKKGTWCPQCSYSLGERICREYFEQLFGKKFQKVKPIWLKSKGGYVMELDGYCPSLKLAFEHQGKQHYDEIAYFHETEGKYAQQLDRDKDKKALCQKKGIVLIGVPEIGCLLPLDKLQSFILRACSKEGKSIPLDAHTKKIDLCKIYSMPHRVIEYEKLCRIAQQKGGKCLSKKYVYSKDKSQWRCAKGHVWAATFSAIKYGRWCPECCIKNRADRQRSNIGEMSVLAESRGGECLSKKYVNNHTSLEWQCSKGHVWKTSPDTIQGGSWCPECAIEDRASKRRSTLEEMSDIAKYRGGKCLSREYVNSITPLEWQCAKGHKWKATPGSVKARTWCPACAVKSRAKKRLLSIGDMQIRAKAKGGKCLASEYMGAFTALSWQCSKGHVWKTSPDTIQGGSWCPECANKSRADKQKGDIANMHKLAKSQGGKCLSENYVNARTCLRWECAKGHRWKANPNNIQQGKWCPQCAMNRRKNT